MATMQGAMQLFTHTTGDTDVTLNALMIGDCPRLCGNNVATALVYALPRNAVRYHVDEEDRATLHSLRGTDLMPL